MQLSSQGLALGAREPLLQLEVGVLVVLEQARLGCRLCGAVGMSVVVLGLEHVNCVWRLRELYRMEVWLQSGGFSTIRGDLLEICGRHHFLCGILGFRASLLQLVASLKVGGANGIVVARPRSWVVEMRLGIRLCLDGHLL